MTWSTHQEVSVQARVINLCGRRRLRQGVCSSIARSENYAEYELCLDCYPERQCQWLAALLLEIVLDDERGQENVICVPLGPEQLRLQSFRGRSPQRVARELAPPHLREFMVELMAKPPGQPWSHHMREGVHVSSGNLGKCQQNKAKAFPGHAIARHDASHQPGLPGTCEVMLREGDMSAKCCPRPAGKTQDNR